MLGTHILTISVKNNVCHSNYIDSSFNKYRTSVYWVRYRHNLLKHSRSKSFHWNTCMFTEGIQDISDKNWSEYLCISFTKQTKMYILRYGYITGRYAFTKIKFSFNLRYICSLWKMVCRHISRIKITSPNNKQISPGQFYPQSYPAICFLFSALQDSSCGLRNTLVFVFENRPV